MKRRIKSFFKRLLVKLFHGGQRLGMDVLPRHFYSEIPVIYRLRKEEAWRQPYSLVGLNADPEEQLQFARKIVTPEIRDHLQRSDVYSAACAENGEAGYGPIEGQFLYAFVRRCRPMRIVQIGCGVSTAICLAAATDENYNPVITCIEPFPSPFLVRAALAGRIRLIEQKVELLPLDFVGELKGGDCLFVDSTHTLGPAGEVTRIILEVLPRLADGVHVHFHDICLPYDFSPTILDEDLFFWHETALLHAFLCFNYRFRVRLSLSQLHHQRVQDLSALFSGYEPMQFDRGVALSEGHYPSSIFLEVVPLSGSTAGAEVS
jgi:Methyltransferase domain